MELNECAALGTNHSQATRRPAPVGAAPLSCNGIDTRVKKLKKEIQARKKEIKRLSAIRNDLSSISRLPAELLAKIFSEVVTAVGYKSGKVPSWMAITHVCQRWRAVAIDSSVLWTDISFHWSPAWVKVMLQRSKQSKLDIVTSSATNAPLDLINQALDVSRLRSLETQNPVHGHIIASRLEHGAPHLEKLSLMRWSNTYKLPPGCLATNTPKLKALTLANYTLSPWGSKVITALHSFDLSLDLPDAATGDELLDGLDGMHALSRLRLAGLHLPLIVDCRVVRLPRLESLHISNVSVGTGTALLNSLAVPLTAKVDLSDYHVDDEDPQTISDLISAFRRCCLTSSLNPSAFTSPPTFKYIALELGWAVALRATLHEPPARLRPEASYNLEITSSGLRPAARLSSNLLESLPLGETCRIDLSVTSKHQHVDITALLDLPKVSTVHVTGTEAAALFLRDAEDDGFYDDGSPIPFPGLRNLLFFDVDFKHDPRRPQAVNPTDLASFVNARKAMGAEIQRLRLAGCPMYKKDKAKFKPQCRVLEVSDGYCDD
jgi:F-box-like